ncbi:hypothetical protein [Methylomonas albis]|nr:hypothetical protein [Methylomonas albis]
MLGSIGRGGIGKDNALKNQSVSYYLPTLSESEFLLNVGLHPHLK